MREEHRFRVFENRVLKRIFRPKRDEITREWRKLHNGELNDLHSSPNIGRGVWVEYVACVGEKRGIYRVLVGKPEGKRPFGRPRIDGRIILRWIFRKWDVGVWTGLSRFRIGKGGGYL